MDGNRTFAHLERRGRHGQLMNVFRKMSKGISHVANVNGDLVKILILIQ